MTEFFHRYLSENPKGHHKKQNKKQHKTKQKTKTKQKQNKTKKKKKKKEEKEKKNKTKVVGATLVKTRKSVKVGCSKHARGGIASDLVHLDFSLFCNTSVNVEFQNKDIQRFEYNICWPKAASLCKTSFLQNTFL